MSVLQFLKHDTALFHELDNVSTILNTLEAEELEQRRKEGRDFADLDSCW